MLAIFLPYLIGAGVTWFLLRPHIAPRPCAVLTPEERAAVDATLAMSAAELTVAGQAQGRDRAGVVADLYQAADRLASKGCVDDAARFRAKGYLVGRAADMPMLPPPAAAQLPAPPMMPPAPAMPMPMSSPAPAPTPPPATPEAPVGQPVVAIMYMKDRGVVRAAPVAGEAGFGVPKGFRVDVTSFGPAGWARVELDHPDVDLPNGGRGPARVPGYVELGLVQAEQPPPGPAMAMPMQAQPAMTGARRPGAGGAPRMPPGGLAKPSKVQRSRMEAQRRRAKQRAAFQGKSS